VVSEWCCARQRAPAPTCRSPPPPRTARAKAELLIGRWQIVQINDRKMTDKNVHINEYCADGSFFTHRTSALRPPSAGGGTYKLVGDTIQCHRFTSQGKEVRWEIQITSITQTGATFFQSEDNEKWVWQLKRLPQK
jgi:hypothetical protein